MIVLWMDVDARHHQKDEIHPQGSKIPGISLQKSFQ
jgi:hypothetical protein